MTLRSVQSVTVWLVTNIATRLGVSPDTIDVRERISRYGLDSLAATDLLTELAGEIGHSLSPTLFWEQPTIERLAQHVVANHLADVTTAAPPVGGNPLRNPPVSREPIAIVGLACRFPGAANPEAYWQLLCDGVDAISEATPDRLNADDFYDPDPAVPGKTTSRWGGFIDHVDSFDPQCFGISPREAVEVDPQQRLALEVSWEALENAGLPVDKLAGTCTGVFFGAMWNDYKQLRSGRVDQIAQHTATGQDTSIIAARVSYTLGLQGPSIAVNTACSSSLVAVHLACQSLHNGDSEIAIAGGVNLLLAPESTVAMSKFGGLSPDGRCFTFDARANGYVRGEGAGAVVLKPLSRAIADGDSIYCVIRGSAVNNDGASNGLTAPNPQAQQDVLRAAYARAEIDPAKVHYIEAHGTGTFLGDPIEVKSLGSVLCPERAAAEPLVIGSVKSNIGHLESAAGIAGIIKTALCIKHDAIPASLHVDNPNPHIPFADLNIRVQRALGPWPRDPATPATAGISSFGFGGTNCHVVVQGAPLAAADVLPLSADSHEALRAAAQTVRDWLDTPCGQAPIAHICSAAAAKLSSGRHRLAVTGRARADITAGLDAFLRQESKRGVFCGPVANDEPVQPVWVFSGQGCQWPGMGIDLLRAEPEFRAVIAQCNAVIAHLAGWSLHAELTADSQRSRMHEAAIAWPTIVAFEIALARLWRSWGIEPAAVVGHSIGEVAAAHVAGALSLEDALRVICAQGQFIQRTSGQGAMALVAASWDQTGDLLSDYQGQLHRAIRTSPNSTVVTGDAHALAALLADLHSREIFARRVQGEVPAHSPNLAPMREELTSALANLRPHRAQIPFMSTVTGAASDGAELTANYWATNFVSPVLFMDAIAALRDQGQALFIEVSPHPIVKRDLEATLQEGDAAAVVVPSLHRGEDALLSLRDGLGLLYIAGVAPRWDRIYTAGPETTETTVDLPQVQPAVPVSRDDDTATNATYVVPLSARSEPALAALAQEYRNLATSGAPSWSLRDLAHSAAVHRSHLEHRVAVVAASLADVDKGLAAFARGRRTRRIVKGPRPIGAPNKLAFVFAGQGAQWLGMGRVLMRREAQFRDLFSACDDLFAPLAGWSLVAELYADEANSRLQSTEVVQPLLFALQVALAGLWKSWGVTPDAVIGHSVGEIAAAHTAGVLSLEDAIRLVYHRGRIMQPALGRGRMIAVESTVEDLAEITEQYHGQISIAAVNGPSSVVLSGDIAAIDEVMTALAYQDIDHRPVRTNYAFHSHQMVPFQEPFCQAIQDLVPAQAQCDVYSTVTATTVAGTALDSAYWAENIRAPVRFADAVRTAIGDGYQLFLEIGPHPVLSLNLQQCLDSENQSGGVLASLRRDQDDCDMLARALAGLYAHGGSLSWAQVYPVGHRRVPLPTYPFQRQRYWAATESQPSSRLPRAGAGAHPLLGNPFTVPLLQNTRLWEQVLSSENMPYLADHCVDGDPVVPGAAYLEMALAAATAALGPDVHVTLQNVSFERMLPLPGDEARTVQTLVRSQDGAAEAASGPVAGAGTGTVLSTGTDRAVVEIFSSGVASKDAAQPATWVRHVQATAAMRNRAEAHEPNLEAIEAIPIEAIQARCPHTRDHSEHYQQMAERGLDYGNAFRGVEQLWLGRDEILGRVVLPSVVAGQTGTYQVHPALVDACIQVLMALFFAGDDTAAGAATLVPVRVGAMRVYRRPERALWAHARVAAEAAANTTAGDLILRNQDGQVVAEISGLEVRQVASTARARLHSETWLHRVTWHQQALAANGAAPAGTGQDGAAPEIAAVTAGIRPATWLVFMDNDAGLGAALCAQLQARGDRCVTVVRGPNYQRLTADSYQVAPARAEDVRAVLRDAFGDTAPCRGVVCLWSLDATPVANTTIDSLQADQWLSSINTLHVAQAIIQHSWRDIPRQWLITRGVQAVNASDHPIAVAQAPLWGLGRVLALEHPELQCTCVDLVAQHVQAPERDREARALVAELCADDVETQVALRDNGRYTARLDKRSFSANGEVNPPIRGDRTYLITGGLGGLGLYAAQWLVDRGARHLVLMSRRQTAADCPQGATALAAMSAAGASVVSARADVAQTADVAQVLADIDARMPPLGGLIHAAGVLDDSTAMQLTAEQFHTVMRPKMLGAWNLHTLTADRPLDFFVCYSSAASLLGFAGQGNYAAANAFLDALAQQRQFLTLPGLSINWGPFSQVGMAVADASRGERLSYRGIGSISPAQGMEVLERLLGHDEGAIGVLPLDVRQWLEFYPSAAEAPFLRTLLREQARTATSTSAAVGLRDRLLAVALDARLPVVEDYVRELASQVLNIDPDQIDSRKALGDMGLDSLMSIELRNRLEASVGSKLAATLLFTYPNVAALAEYVLECLALPDIAATPAPNLKEGDPDQEQRLQLAQEVASLTDDEAEKLLRENLDSLFAEM